MRQPLFPHTPKLPRNRNRAKSTFLVPLYDNNMTPSIPTIVLFGLSLINSCTAQLVDGALVGTWTTKSKAVLTGPGFYNPVTDKLTEPNHPGISYSFTEDGHYEEAYYRAISNRKMRTGGGTEQQMLTITQPHNQLAHLQFCNGNTEPTLLKPMAPLSLHLLRSTGVK
jgi:Chaperone for protein-folding within the ER, fungal